MDTRSPLYPDIAGLGSAKPALGIAARLKKLVAAICVYLVPCIAAAENPEKVYEFGKDFGSGLDTYPAGGLVQGADGAFYGTTQGLTDEAGTIFKVTPSGEVTVLMAFPDVDFDYEESAQFGSGPRAGLTRSSDGYFYGSTETGGAEYCGIIFRVSPAGDFKKLVDFTGSDGIAKGAAPSAELLASGDGYFYGTTVYGGAYGKGVVFKMSPSGTLTTLVEFTGNEHPTDTSKTRKGSASYAPLIQAADGTLYGTTYYGGAQNLGTVFKVNPDGSNFTTLVEFTGETGLRKGENPNGPLSFGLDGQLYGTTEDGGSGGQGTIFRVSPLPGGAFQTLVEFTGGGAQPGSSPRDNLLRDIDGNFYGTTSYSIFKMTPDGTILFTVEPEDDEDESIDSPVSLVFGGDGNLYGINLGGGGPGSIFRMTPQGTLTTIAEASYGEFFGPDEITSLADGGDGSIFGTIEKGVTGHGSVFRLSSGGVQTTLLEFTGDGSKPGDRPLSLIRASNGFFYGVTRSGGSSGNGTIFRMNREGAHTVLHRFTGGTDGQLPNWITEGPGGMLFGTTEGSGGDPAIAFRISPEGNYEKLFTFTGKTGAYPGEQPNRLMLASDGNLYGSTGSGGANDRGTLFKLSPAGAYSLLHQFDYPDHSYLSTGTWQNVPLSRRSQGQFTIEFNITPKANGMDGVTGLCLDPADSYTDLACIVRLAPEGRFDVRNGNNYTRDASYAYTAGVSYHVTMMVDLALHRYSVAINGTPIATNYAFRSEQASTGAFKYLGLRNESGSHEVWRISLEDGGSRPGGALVEASPGFLYGTAFNATAESGASLFRLQISPTASFSDLGELQGNAQAGNGNLLGLPDGSLLGTTISGGEFGFGNIFKIKTDGSLSNFTNFPRAELSHPLDPLIRTEQGLLYGVTEDNQVYRVVPPGAPAIYDSGAHPEKAVESLFLQEKICARAAVASVYLDYCFSPVPIPPEGPFPFNSQIFLGATSGFLPSPMGTTLTSLQPGAYYYYRYRATNEMGATHGPVRSFLSVGRPVVKLGDATEVGKTRATVHGTINALYEEASVAFEYSSNVNFLPAPPPVIVEKVEGNTPQARQAELGGLTPGTTYYYRIKASGDAGYASPQEVGTFRTLVDPEVHTGGTEVLNTTEAWVYGSVNPMGDMVDVRFEYRLKDAPGVAPSVPADLSELDGTQSRDVKAFLKLAQGTTYQYRLVAGRGERQAAGNWELLNTSILSGLDRVFPTPLPAPSGVLTVQTTQAGGKGSWRLTGELDWRPSGSSATGLATGDRTIEFRPLKDLIQPPNLPVFVDSTLPPVIVSGNDGEYFTQGASPLEKGSLQVTLEPYAVLADRRWRFKGEDDTEWRASGETRGDLVPGNYLVECENFSTRVAPVALVNVAAGPTTSLTLVYPERQQEHGLAQQAVSYSTLSADGTLPFAYTGQLRSPAGTASGFAVKRRVVATAAHVIWNDGTKAAVEDMQWLLQRHAGVHEPVPQEPRGYFIGSGYAAEREAPGVKPGEGTAQSQHYDYAALYFLNDAARGGFSGFLASESDTNEFLTADTPKILAGYATDIDNSADRGKLHATPFTSPPSFALEQVPGTIGGQSYRTYFTTRIYGRAGSSGGPLFAKRNGIWYPAAIYLGGGSQTIVRSIDREVAEIFDKAETRGFGSGNSTDGGRILSFSAGGTPSRGSLKVDLLPESLAGRHWKLLPSDAPRAPGNQRDRLRPGKYVVSLAKLDGYLEPADQTVEVAKSTITALSYRYRTVREQWRYDHFGTFDNTGEAADDADPDRDGSSNQEEYAAGTEPKQAGDFFRVQTCTRTAGGFSVTISGKKGRAYVLESSATLLPGSWVAQPPVGPLAADQPSLILTAPASTERKRFYRVRVEAP